MYHRTNCLDYLFHLDNLRLVNGSKFDEMLRELKLATTNRDTKSIAQLATLSAELNQPYVPNPYFAELNAEYTGFGALGIVVAHTGTIAGLLFDTDARHAVDDLQQRFPQTRVELTHTHDAN